MVFIENRETIRPTGLFFDESNMFASKTVNLSNFLMRSIMKNWPVFGKHIAINLVSACA
jgi:hypothetical protein